MPTITQHDLRYTPDQLHYLVEFNEYVGAYLWVGLFAVIAIATALNLYSKSHSIRRRFVIKRWIISGIPPVKGCSRTGKGCTRWVPATFLALFRKWTIRKGKYASIVHFTNLGQVSLVLGYITLNLALCFGGALGDISWQAHHAARLSFANLPLVIGFASKNNFFSYMTGFSYESLNVLHRWSARMVFFLSVIHVAGRIYINQPSASPNGHGQGYIVCHRHFTIHIF